MWPPWSQLQPPVHLRLGRPRQDTHLLHAIGHQVHHHYQHDVVRYVSTETFLNEYVDGIRTNTIAPTSSADRDIDVLLIDDIQFMEGKEGLQEEFFHTFNSSTARTSRS
ncbi:MAG: DnaA/Hda family protein [Ilumatobacteraceae bacterium]